MDLLSGTSISSCTPALASPPCTCAHGVSSQDYLSSPFQVSFGRMRIGRIRRTSRRERSIFGPEFAVCRAYEVPKFADFLTALEEDGREKDKDVYEGLSARERRKLRNERREELKASTEPWRETVENRLDRKRKSKYRSVLEGTDVNQLKLKGMQWWLILTTRKFENQVAEQLDIIFSDTFPDRDFEVLVPTVPSLTKLKDGKPSSSRKKLFQGMVLLRCIMDRTVYDLVRRIPRAFDFYGHLAGVSFQPMVMPAPVSHMHMENLFKKIRDAEREHKLFQEQCFKEIEEMKLAKKNAEQQAKEAPALQIGEGASFRVLSGPFTDFPGIVTDVLPEASKVKALVTVFGRQTPIVLDVDQVEVTAAAPPLSR